LKLVLSTLAHEDLFSIFSYISINNPAVARRFTRELRDLCGRLAESPGIGKLRPELDRRDLGIKSFPYGNYLVFYYLAGKELRVLRILHGARNIDDDLLDIVEF
jgi:plasmid stabilization system protein ParE